MALIIHLVLLRLSYLSSQLLKLALPEKIALLFTASQKTLPLSLAFLFALPANTLSPAIQSQEGGGQHRAGGIGARPEPIDPFEEADAREAAKRLDRQRVPPSRASTLAPVGAAATTAQTPGFSTSASTGL